MKKLILVSTLIFATILSGCGKKPVDVQNNQQLTQQQEENKVSDFYSKITSDDTRPIAIMIDNDDKSARPQIGLEDAFIVYEIIVEGGSTRFLALYKDKSPEKIGPIRSSRHYFLDYALENDAIYVHSGWSPKAAKDISALSVNNINGILGSDGVNFWRDNTYNSSWHNLYTSVPKLREYSDKSKKYRQSSQELLLSYKQEDTDITGDNATNIDLRYSYHYSVQYKYNNEKKMFERYINSEPHKSQTGEIVSCKNILIYKVQNYNLQDGEDKGRQDLKNIGSGKGYYLSNGKVTEINWSKSSRREKTKYTLENGENLEVNPGNTFIQIVPTGYDIVIE